MRKNAIVLFSGGLDSILVYKIVEQWGFEIFAINFVSPFIKALDKTYYKNKYNIDFVEYNFAEQQIAAVKNPKYGYGKAINPCIDCHAAMLKEAKKAMNKMGALFIASGEVIGQRPMSQRREAINSVDKLSETKGFIVRPLSGGLLPETMPEKEGTIKRGWLYKISGRGRKEQYKICEELGIKDIPSSGGGCLLTEKSFVNKVKIAVNYGNNAVFGCLRAGRVFDLGDGILILARNQRESEYLLLVGGNNIIEPVDVAGPTGIIYDSKNINLACAILGKYSKKNREYIRCKYKGNTIGVRINDEKVNNSIVY